MIKVVIRRREKIIEIRSIEIDIDRNILKINGKDVEQAVVVSLPGPGGWPVEKLFNPDSWNPEERNKIEVQISSKLLKI